MLDRCPGCAKEVPDAADECPECGFKFVVDAPPPSTHGDADNDPVLDGPASLETNDPTLDPPASRELDNDDLLAIQTGSGLPRTYDQDSYEPPKKPAQPPKSQAAVFVIAGLCIAAMAVSSYYFKRQKRVEAERAVAAQAQAAAEQAKALIEAERAAAEKAAALAKEAEEKRLAAAQAEETAAKKAGKRRRRKGRRSNALEAPTRRSGLPEESAVIAEASPVTAHYDTPEIPSTDSETPDYGSDFRIKGAVYDLYTMEPIGEADVVFSDLKSGRQLSTVTDDSGVFRAHLPINGKGYSLKIRHSRYEPKYIEDSSPSLREMSADQRRSEGAELIRSMARQTTFNALRKTVIKRDFMLIPR